ncbi:MAG: hypothetical protein ACYCQI_01935 [Gammaproteobacteria bacterium]
MTTSRRLSSPQIEVVVNEVTEFCKPDEASAPIKTVGAVCDGIKKDIDKELKKALEFNQGLDHRHDKKQDKGYESPRPSN